jgi:hypothetical protein
MPQKTPPAIVPFSLAAIIACSLSLPAFGETKTPEDAQTLLQEVKKRDLEREIAAKQIEFNRLTEDLAKVRAEADDLKTSITSIDTAANEASTNLERLSAERARLSQALEVATLRVEAEKLKVTGLKMLSEGQAKVLGYASGRGEVTERKAEIAAAELKLINFQNLPATEPEPILDSSSPAANPSGTDTTAKLKAQIAELKKKGLKSQQTLLDASAAAATAINAASAKLALADAAATKASQRADELGLAAGLAPVAAGPSEEPAITAPKATAIRQPAAASKPAITSKPAAAQ